MSEQSLKATLAVQEDEDFVPHFSEAPMTPKSPMDDDRIVAEALAYAAAKKSKDKKKVKKTA